MTRLVIALALAAGCAQPLPVGTHDMRSTSHDMAVGGDGGTKLGDGGTVLSGDMARAWSDESYTGYPDGGTLWSVYNDGNGSVLTVGDYGTVLRSHAGGAFLADPSSVPARPALLSISAVPGPIAFIAGFGGALWKYAGTDFTSTGTWNADEPGVGDNLYAVWTAPDGMAFAAGNGVLLQRKTSGSFNWTSLTGGPTTGDAAYAIWGTMTGTGTYAVYAVGCHIGTGSTTGCGGARIWYTDGSGTVTSQSTPTSEALYGVWGSSATDVYAVGDVGVVLHSAGDGTWVAQNSGVAKALEAIGGSGPNEIYIVGDVDTTGTIVLQKLDQTLTFWDRVTVPQTNNRFLTAVSATTTDIYFVGQGGAILHK